MVSISFIIRILGKNTKFIDYKRNILSFFIYFLPNGTKHSTAKTKKSDSIEKTCDCPCKKDGNRYICPSKKDTMDKSTR
jgi:hypothetical protein